MTVLEAIAEGVWGQTSIVRLPGGMRMPCRATILRLPTGGMAIHSPVTIGEQAAREIDALGRVEVLIAPSCGHWVFLEAAKARYPNARVFAAAGLEKKLGKLPFEPLPTSGAIDGLGMAVERIGGAPAMGEHVFLHEASRTLVVSDLVFNVRRCESFMMRCVLRLTGTWNKTAQSRVWRLVVKDRAAAATSAAHVLSWDFERVVVGHGDVIEDDARQRMREALGWMAGAGRPLLHAGAA